MSTLGFRLPEKRFQIQKVMLRVCWALSPLVLASVYLFGWRSLVLIAVVFLFGILTEAVFTFRQGKPITSAVFVTCLIFSLSLPPRLPFWMAVIGIVFGVAIGKMVFGGFGFNVFNPAMVGRCFLYITFPVEMTNQWVTPPGRGGLLGWSLPFDSITTATPLVNLHSGNPFPLPDLFFGVTSGSMGETSAVLILIGGVYILWKKAAPWRLALSCLLGGLIISSVLWGAGSETISSPLHTLLAGSFLFGTAFVVTEPISGPKTKQAQWLYGFFIGGLTIILRAFSNFSEGIMFSVLLMNAFAPFMDQTVQGIVKKREPK